MPTALVRRPGPRLADGIVTHQTRVPVDVDLAERQWTAYVDVFRDRGWSIVEVEPADACPDAPFVEDAVVVFDDLAVVARPGHESRTAEIDGAEAAVRDLGLEVHAIDGPGTLDGGDVLKVGRDVYVGVSDRTTAPAIAQLAAVVSPRGWIVRPVPVRRVLHLKSAVTALPDGTVIGHTDLVDDPTAFDSFEPVPEPAGAHVVVLDEHSVLIAAGAPETAALLRHRGLTVIEVDISEFEKLEGCVTCLSVRVRGQGELRPHR